MTSTKNLLGSEDKRSLSKFQMVVLQTRKTPSLFKEVYDAIYAEDEVFGNESN